MKHEAHAVGAEAGSVIVGHGIEALLRDEVVGLRLVAGVRLLVHGDVQDGHARGIPAARRVVVHDVRLHLRRGGDAVGAPDRKPFEEHDAPGKVAQVDRAADGHSCSVGSREGAACGHGKIGHDVADLIRRGGSEVGESDERQREPEPA